MIPTFRAPIPLFHVFDLDASLAFYVNTLNFELVAATESELREETSRTWAMLRAGDFTLMLQTAYKEEERPVLPDPTRVLYHEDVVLYFLCSDLEALCAQFRRKGTLTVRGMDTFANMDQVFIRDPDGYMLCFQTPSEPSPDHA